jgi:hypothetical protein
MLWDCINFTPHQIFLNDQIYGKINFAERVVPGRTTYKILVGKAEGENWLDVSIAPRIVLKWMFKKLFGSVWAGLVWL